MVRAPPDLQVFCSKGKVYTGQAEGEAAVETRATAQQSAHPGRVTDSNASQGIPVLLEHDRFIYFPPLRVCVALKLVNQPKLACLRGTGPGIRLWPFRSKVASLGKLSTHKEFLPLVLGALVG